MSQPLPIRDQLTALEQLQEIDIKIDELKRQKEGIPVELRNQDQALAQVQARITQKETAVAEVEKILRQAQAAIDLNSDRLARANKKLEAVSTGPEFQAANKEIEQLKRHNAGLEEQRSKATNDIAAIRQEIETIQKELGEKQSAREELAQKLGGRGAELDAEIGKLETERKQVSPKVDRPLLSRYDRVRAARAGQGLAAAVGGRCKACNMILPPQLFNEVQKFRTVQSCPSCNRVLTVPSEEGSAEGSRQAEASQG